MEFWRVWLRLQNVKLGYSDNVFHMFHVPFAGRFFAFFTRSKVRVRKLWWSYVRVASFSIHLLFPPTFFGSWDMRCQNKKWVLLFKVQVWFKVWRPPRKNVYKDGRKWIERLKDKISRWVDEKKILSQEKRRKSANKIK